MRQLLNGTILICALFATQIASAGSPWDCVKVQTKPVDPWACVKVVVPEVKPAVVIPVLDKPAAPTGHWEFGRWGRAYWVNDSASKPVVTKAATSACPSGQCPTSGTFLPYWK